MAEGGDRLVHLPAQAMSDLRPVPDELVTRECLADILQVSVRTVDRMREEGMPDHHWGRRLVRFRVHEVMRWLDERDERKAA